MALVNEHLLKLPENYLFTDIVKRVNSFKVTHPQARIIHLGIGDVTLPIPKACVEAMQKAAGELGNPNTFRGYGPEQGFDFLIEAILKHELQTLSTRLTLTLTFHVEEPVHWKKTANGVMWCTCPAV